MIDTEYPALLQPEQLTEALDSFGIALDPDTIQRATYNEQNLLIAQDTNGWYEVYAHSKVVDQAAVAAHTAILASEQVLKPQPDSAPFNLRGLLSQHQGEYLLPDTQQIVLARVLSSVKGINDAQGQLGRVVGKDALELVEYNTGKATAGQWLASFAAKKVRVASMAASATFGIHDRLLLNHVACWYALPPAAVQAMAARADNLKQEYGDKIYDQDTKGRTRLKEVVAFAQAADDLGLLLNNLFSIVQNVDETPDSALRSISGRLKTHQGCNTPAGIVARSDLSDLLFSDKPETIGDVTVDIAADVAALGLVDPNPDSNAPYASRLAMYTDHLAFASKLHLTLDEVQPDPTATAKTTRLRRAVWEQIIEMCEKEAA